MDAKQAAATARRYFEDVFSERPTLEEIWFDSEGEEWCVTLGRRRMIRERTASVLDDFTTGARVQEVIDYKVVRISDKDGEVKSVRLREGERAA